MSEVKQDSQEEGKNLQQNKTKQKTLIPEVPKQEKQSSETWLINIIKITFHNTKVRTQEFTERA